MGIPEVIPWENVLEFRINGTCLGDDIHLSDFLAIFTGQAIDLLLFENQAIDCIAASNEEVVNSWLAYSCLYCEINYEGTYILSNGKWYEIQGDFATVVNNDFINLRDNSVCPITFPNCNNGEWEDRYNARVSTELNICKMDRVPIILDGPYNQIEFCDLLTSDKRMIHVKHYGAFSVFSHLFSQGLVSR